MTPPGRATNLTEPGLSGKQAPLAHLESHQPQYRQGLAQPLGCGVLVGGGPACHWEEPSVHLLDPWVRQEKGLRAGSQCSPYIRLGSAALLIPS